MPSPLWPTPLEEWQFLLARELTGIFHAEAWEARDGAVRFRGRLLVDPDQAFAILSDRLRPLGYVPQLLRPDEIALLRLGLAPMRSGVRRWAVPAGLFLATILSTLFAGATDFDPALTILHLLATIRGRLFGGGVPVDPCQSPIDIRAGLVYSASILGILLVHELGHYVTARLYGMRVSLPYFIPMPVGFIGTMGAIIRMRSPVPSRRALFDVGIAGPLAGLLVAVPVSLVGLHLSKLVPVVADVCERPKLGLSFLFAMVARLVLASPPPGWGIALHPMAVAGWLGLFVTALNLIPAGQLDGGHIGYAVLGRRHNTVALIMVLALFGMAALLHPMWGVWGLLLLLLGYRHPPPLNDLTPLDPVRRTVGILSWGLFLALIPPVPFAL